MKKIKNSIINLFCILICILLNITSCCYHYPHEETTAAGKLIYKETASTIKGYAESLDLALRVNAYLQSGEEERENILSSLLVGYDISENENNIILVKGEDLTWEIKRNSTNSLAVSSTEWCIKSDENSTFVFSENSFRIIAQSAANIWNIEVANAYKQNSQSTGSVVLEIQMIADDNDKLNSIVTNSYVINTVGDALGKITSSDGILYSTYKITESIICDLDDIIDDTGYEKVITEGMFLEGWLDMTAVRTDQNITDIIYAKIIRDGDYIDIELGGISEEYRFDYIWED